MTIAVLGTGTVGRTIAGKLVELGHQVLVGTRDVQKTIDNKDSDGMGTPPFSQWLAAHSQATLTSFADAAAAAELIVNATSGYASLQALQAAGEANLASKVLIDLSNPLDFTKGMPPSLFVCNTDSLAEQIQSAFPKLKVVKTLNTLTAELMVNPKKLANGDHTIFVSGNDADAKAVVVKLLKEGFLWSDVLDLGDITTARGTEMYLALWLRTWSNVQTPLFNLKVVR